jgi:hypothetical protein
MMIEIASGDLQTSGIIKTSLPNLGAQPEELSEKKPYSAAGRIQRRSDIPKVSQI